MTMTHEMPMGSRSGLVDRYRSALALADAVPLSLVQLAARIAAAIAARRQQASVRAA